MLRRRDAITAAALFLADRDPPFATLFPFEAAGELVFRGNKGHGDDWLHGDRGRRRRRASRFAGLFQRQLFLVTRS